MSVVARDRLVELVEQYPAHNPTPRSERSSSTLTRRSPTDGVSPKTSASTRWLVSYDRKQTFDLDESTRERLAPYRNELKRRIELNTDLSEDAKGAPLAQRAGRGK